MEEYSNNIKEEMLNKIIMEDYGNKEFNSKNFLFLFYCTNILVCLLSPFIHIEKEIAIGVFIITNIIVQYMIYLQYLRLNKKDRIIKNSIDYYIKRNIDNRDWKHNYYISKRRSEYEEFYYKIINLFLPIVSNFLLIFGIFFRE